MSVEETAEVACNEWAPIRAHCPCHRKSHPGAKAVTDHVWICTLRYQIRSEFSRDGSLKEAKLQVKNLNRGETKS